MNVSYTITGSETAGTQILVVIGGESHTITENHPSFDRIQDALLDGEFDGLKELIDVQGTILSQLSENVTISGNTLYFRGEPLYDRLAETVVNFYSRGRNFKKLVNFMERLFLNPSKHSRTQLFNFLDAHDFTITDDGHFLAYKGVDSTLRSLHAGPGVVNGTPQNGLLDNTPGNVLEMLRSDVMDDPSVACAEGLHAGTWEYARNFGSRVVEVKIDPADVASVPNDSAFQKIRTAKYVVLREVESQVASEERYDVEDDFMRWLGEYSSDYTYKGKVATNYTALVYNYADAFPEEDSLTREQLDALLSVAAELDSEHSSMRVYRYHIDKLLLDYYADSSRENEVFEEDEDEYEGYDPW